MKTKSKKLSISDKLKEDNNEILEEKNISINVKRIQEITVVPSTILHMNYVDNFIVVARSDHSIEIWENNDWVMITKIYGNKSKYLLL